MQAPLSWLGSRLPLIQAPMAGAQDAGLALAVGAAGGLGSLPAALLGPDALRSQMHRLQSAGRPWLVNFFAHQPAAPDPVVEARWVERLRPWAQALGLDAEAAAPRGAVRQPFGPATCELLEAFRPTVVSFHFGLPPDDLLNRVRRTGARIVCSATTLREARWLEARGVDAVIAQGLEAGGHRGHFLDPDPSLQGPTLELLQAWRAQVKVPLIAAGGITDADDVRAAMASGAAAVQVGTAFLCCEEALTSSLHRTRLLDPHAPTALTNLFSGGLARGLENRLMRELGPVCADAPPFPLASPALAPLRERAEALGRDDFTPLWSGKRRGGCRTAPAAEVVAALARGFAGNAPAPLPRSPAPT